MSNRPIPIVFEPIFKAKPWGGRRLGELFGKRLPAGGPVGESWELAQLPGNESRVHGGPAAGKTIGELIAEWGEGLHGGGLVDGRFPLLIKFLDARENLSVQVHPRLDADGGRSQPDVKHECWYVVAAEPDAEIFIGLKPGVTLDDVAAVVGSAGLVDLLQRRRAKRGYCYFLPSGVVHALGSGVVVAEIQTPADVTYRLYDWDRIDAEGRRRELHEDLALANIRFDVREDQIRQPRRHVGSVFTTSTRMVACERFVIEKVRVSEGLHQEISCGAMTTWIVTAGHGVISCEDGSRPYSAGDVVLIPAGARQPVVETESDSEWLEVLVPMASTLSGYDRPPRETPPRDRGGPIQLGRGSGG